MIWVIGGSGVLYVSQSCLHRNTSPAPCKPSGGREVVFGNRRTGSSERYRPSADRLSANPVLPAECTAKIAGTPDILMALGRGCRLPMPALRIAAVPYPTRFGKRFAVLRYESRTAPTCRRARKDGS